MSAETPMIRLLDPTVRPHDADKPLARRPLELRGKRLGILDNTKPNADRLMLHIAAALQQQHGTLDVLHRRKAHAAIGATEALLEEMASRCDVVLLGSGD